LRTLDPLLACLPLDCSLLDDSLIGSESLSGCNSNVEVVISSWAHASSAYQSSVSALLARYLSGLDVVGIIYSAQTDLLRGYLRLKGNDLSKQERERCIKTYIPNVLRVAGNNQSKVTLGVVV
jgi:hypothetical protein